ncbi:MAG: methyltransferase domain-containing protein [Actinomycetota bacterium]
MEESKKTSSNEIQNPKSKIQNPNGAFEKMDKMYRHQRYFYDLTRKYYLLGRDRLISEMKISDRENVLEVGCGTARNLIILAKKYPKANFFGLDASAEMLKTAQSKLDAKNLSNIFLKTALADDFKFDKTFDLAEKFDAIFFSYAVSIIPPWKESIENALENLKAGKSLYIVDFYDQEELPRWFRRILKSWLAQFHVKYPKELIPFVEDLEKKGVGKLKITPLYKRYSLLAEFQKAI